MSGLVAAFGPIHLAFQSAGSTTPATKLAGALHSLAPPFSSHTQTRHVTRCEVFSALFREACASDKLIHLDFLLPELSYSKYGTVERNVLVILGRYAVNTILLIIIDGKGITLVLTHTGNCTCSVIIEHEDSLNTIIPDRTICRCSVTYPSFMVIQLLSVKKVVYFRYIPTAGYGEPCIYR